MKSSISQKQKYICEMKVLFIGAYRDGTGYGHMALDSIRALVAAGAHVTARPVKLNGASHVELPREVQDAEAKKHDGPYDAVVTNLLPHFFDYNGRIPVNVGYYCTETSRFDGSQWAEKINCMDVAWVCNRDSAEASRRSGVTIPIVEMPIACDVSKYSRHYKPLSIRQRLGDSFIFYFIGEFIKRKNISALLQAFHLEFDVNEPVNLVIKTSIGTDGEHEVAVREIDKVKEAMKLYPNVDQYKREIILIGHYTDEEIMRLHASCDCFVCPSFGEAWCLPAFDAMAMNKTPIVTDAGGFRAYMNPECGWLVKSSPAPVFAMHSNGLGDLYTGRENWDSVDIGCLRAAMRAAYEASPHERAEMGKAGRTRAQDFSYGNVGTMMMEAIANGL